MLDRSCGYVATTRLHELTALPICCFPFRLSPSGRSVDLVSLHSTDTSFAGITYAVARRTEPVPPHPIIIRRVPFVRGSKSDLAYKLSLFNRTFITTSFHLHRHLLCHSAFRTLSQLECRNNGHILPPEHIAWALCQLHQ